MEESKIVELRTGVIPAAIYANKLRRLALFMLKDIPREILLRDIAELNQNLYRILIEEYKVEKSTPIKISVKVYFDKNENKLKFIDLKLDRFYPESEIVEKYNKEIKKYKEESEYLKNQIEKIKEEYELKIEELKKENQNIKEKYEEELNKLKEENQKYKKERENLKNLIFLLYESIKSIV